MNNIANQFERFFLRRYANSVVTCNGRVYDHVCVFFVLTNPVGEDTMVRLAVGSSGKDGNRLQAEFQLEFWAQANGRQLSKSDVAMIYHAVDEAYRFFEMVPFGEMSKVCV